MDFAASGPLSNLGSAYGGGGAMLSDDYGFRVSAGGGLLPQEVNRRAVPRRASFDALHAVGGDEGAGGVPAAGAGLAGVRTSLGGLHAAAAAGRGGAYRLPSQSHSSRLLTPHAGSGQYAASTPSTPRGSSGVPSGAPSSAAAYSSGVLLSQILDGAAPAGEGGGNNGSANGSGYGGASGSGNGGGGSGAPAAVLGAMSDALSRDVTPAPPPGGGASGASGQLVGFPGAGSGSMPVPGFVGCQRIEADELTLKRHIGSGAYGK
eukprot:206273-Chlamydomonas_euryale.AAC.1